MAERPDVSELLRRTVQANASLYKGWVDLSLDYWRRVGEIFGVAIPTGFDTGVFESAELATEDAAGSGVLVLEGDAGTTARGAFLVTNDLGRNVKCVFVASGLSGPRGAKSTAAVRFEPASVELAPGEQTVVHARIPVDDQFTPGAAYTGSVAIRGMDGFSVPFVLRRTHSIEEAERAANQTDPAAPDPAAQPKKPGGATTKPGRVAAKQASNATSAGKSQPKKKPASKKAGSAAGKRRARQKE